MRWADLLQENGLLGPWGQELEDGLAHQNETLQTILVGQWTFTWLLTTLLTPWSAAYTVRTSRCIEDSWAHKQICDAAVNDDGGCVVRTT